VDADDGGGVGGSTACYGEKPTDDRSAVPSIEPKTNSDGIKTIQAPPLMMWDDSCTRRQWRCSGGGARVQLPPPPPKKWGGCQRIVGKFSSCLVRKNFVQKCKILGWKVPILEKFEGRIKNLSTHRLLCRKFAAVCRKVASFCPAYFFNPRRRCYWPVGCAFIAVSVLIFLSREIWDLVRCICNTV